jgi:hypothetical protein
MSETPRDPEEGLYPPLSMSDLIRLRSGRFQLRTPPEPEGAPDLEDEVDNDDGHLADDEVEEER